MTEEIKKSLIQIQTERGLGRDLAGEIEAPTAAPGTGADWFGPLPPMRPVAPPEVAGRQFDYVPGYNLTTQPRYQEPLDFATLRALADAYDPLRLIIERRKDQLCRLPWSIRPKHDENGRRPKQVSASVRERIGDVTAFFRKPDYEISFRSWLRALLEDLFVIDAPVLYCERDQFGSLIGLQNVDGATVKRVIGDDGRIPRPLRWTGAAFMWNGQEINAENYFALGFRVHGGLIYPPAYQQILKGLPAVSLTTRDIYYRTLNWRAHKVYGSSPVEAVINTVNIAMRRQFSQGEYYREGNEPAGIYSLPVSWSPDQVQRFQDYWDNLYVGHLGRRRQMRFMAGEKGSYQPLKEPPLKNEMDEWLCRIICFAFSYPPNAFVHQVNRATAEQHEEQAEREGLEPIKAWASDLFNEIVEREFNSDDLEFVWVEEDDIDPKKQAEVLTAYADSGALTLNEVRERIGEEPSADPAASILAVRTQTGRVPISAVAAASDTKTDDQTNVVPINRGSR